LTFPPGVTKNNSHLLHSDRHCDMQTWLTESMSVADYIFATKAHIDNWKKMLRAICPPDVPVIWLTSAHYSGWDRFTSLGHPS